MIEGQDLLLGSACDQPDVPVVDAILHRPRWIVLENVKAFYGSNVWQRWLQCLDDTGYDYR